MREREIFDAALSISDPVQRKAYLEQACQGDVERQQLLLGMLEAHERLGNFLEVAPNRLLEPTISQLDGARPGTVIGGRYKLIEAIGEGGMGSVWVAEQKEPVKRKVAVKLIKAGMDSKSVLARFDAERQALALMDHPNIAKVFDGGMTDMGRPYFVMEFVKGVSLTEYCNQAKLSLRERLNLFIPVCQAVQHAHQKGIIHRDLKPSNILVCLYDGKPVPKVIDFGLAKAMHQSLTEQTLHTAYGIMVGTPLYMSPEQAEHNNLDVDTRTDVYSLGVMLYELLTGTTPLERQQLKDAAFNEILRLIKESEPPKPSTRLSGSTSLPSIAAQRSIEPNQLRKLLSGDLDWIVMKALDKERSRRYETANGLARDLERHLNDEAVEACPPSNRYRLRKLMRKHQLALGTAASFVTLLLFGAGVSTWQAVRATKAERDAQQALLAEAEQRRLAEDNQRTADELRIRAEAAVIREAEQRAKAEKARDRTREALDAMTSTVAGDALTTQTEISEDQKKFLTEVLTYYQEFAGDKPEDETSRARTAQAAQRVGMIQSQLGRREEGIAAFELTRKGYASLAAEFPATHAYQQSLIASHNYLASLLREVGRSVEAQLQLQTAIAIGEKLAAEFPTEPTYRQHLATSHTQLGGILWGWARRTDAEEQYQKAVAIGTKLTAEFPEKAEYQRDLAISLSWLGGLQRMMPKLAEAEENSRTALAIREKLAAKFSSVREHRQLLASSHHTLGHTLLLSKKLGDAETHYRMALAIREKLAVEFPTVPEVRQHLATSHIHMGFCLNHRGKLPEAGEEYRKALTIREKLITDFPNVPLYQQHVATDRVTLGLLLEQLGKLSEAEELYLQAIAAQERLIAEFPSGAGYHNEYFRSTELVVKNYHLRMKHAEAVQAWDRAIAHCPKMHQLHYRAARVASLVQARKLSEAVAEIAVLTAPVDVRESAVWNADQWYRFACACALASGQSADNKQEVADRAIDLLAKAVRAGFKDTARIKKDTDLDPLRDRMDFQKLLADLEAKVPPR